MQGTGTPCRVHTPQHISSHSMVPQEPHYLYESTFCVWFESGVGNLGVWVSWNICWMQLLYLRGDGSDRDMNDIYSLYSFSAFVCSFVGGSNASKTCKQNITYHVWKGTTVQQQKFIRTSCYLIDWWVTDWYLIGWWMTDTWYMIGWWVTGAWYKNYGRVRYAIDVATDRNEMNYEFGGIAAAMSSISEKPMQTAVSTTATTASRTRVDFIFHIDSTRVDKQQTNKKLILVYV